MYALNNNVTYFDSFGVKHIPKEIKKFINKFTITTNIYIIQTYDSVICRYFCIQFIDFILKGKSLTDFAIDNIILNSKLFQKWVKQLICIQI